MRAPPPPTIAADPPPPAMTRRALLSLYLLLGFSAGLPFYMFNAVLLLRLAKHGVDIVTVGFFAWVALLPTFKFAWAPLLDRYEVPGFGRRYGKRPGWIMLAQLGMVAAMLGMAATASDRSLPLTALFAVLLAFWNATLEIAADAWRIELAPTADAQGPVVAANLWGYRGAMVVAGSGAIYLAAQVDWGIAYLVVAVAGFLPFPILAMMRGAGGGRGRALSVGIAAGLGIVAATGGAIALVGGTVLGAIGSIGLSDPKVVSYWVFAIALLPLLAIMLSVKRLRLLPADAPLRRSVALGPYVDFAWRYGFMVVPILLFVSVYRMGDVMALTLSHPLFNAAGYSLVEISVADGVVALLAGMAGIALGGWLAARAAMGWALTIGAVTSAFSNWVFAWLAHQAPAAWKLYAAMGADAFGHGFEGAVFVVYLSLLVNPRYPAAQYALLSGLAFLLPRLLAGLSGVFQKAIGYDGFFLMAGMMSLAAIVFVPVLVRIRPRVEPA